jgi:hypothetical protein
MHLLLIFAAFFATLRAFPNFWVSESKAPLTLDSMNNVKTFIIVHPIDPKDSNTMEKTVTSLGLICGSEHVESLRSPSGDVSWKIILSDRETLHYLAEHPDLMWDRSLRKTLEDFSRRHEKRSDLTPRDDPYYIVAPTDYTNNEETRATREFLNTKVTNPSDTIYEYTLPGDNLIAGWGHVQLSDAAKKEVEAYPGVIAPLGDNDLIEYDRVVMSTHSSEHQSTETPSERKVSGMIHKSYDDVSRRATSLFKRAVTWTKQQAAGWDLVMVSQPK